MSLEDAIMTAIRQQVVIPEDHKLRLDIEVPPEMPAGEAEVTVVIAPRRSPNQARAVALFREIAARGALRYGSDPAEWQRDIRKDRPLPGRA